MSAMAATVAQERLFSRDFSLLIGGHFLQALGYASMLLLPLYLAHLGASRTEIGVLMATASLSGLMSRPLVGWSLDRIGRKPTLVAGTLALCASMELVALVTRLGALAYAQRIVAGVGLGTLFTAYFTCAADLVPIARRTEGLAIFGVSGLLPLLIDPFADRIGVAPADVRWFLPVVGGAIALSLAAIALLREPSRVPAPSSETAFTLRNAARSLSRRPLWPIWLGVSALSALVALFQIFATVTAEKRGLARPSSVWLSYALAAVAVRVVGGKLPDRIGPRTMVAPSLGSYLAAALVMAKAHTTGAELVAGVLAGVGHGYCFPILTGQLVTRVPEAFRGSALATFTALWTAAELAAGPGFGAVADRWGDAAMFQTAAALGLCALGGWCALERTFAR